MSRPDRQEPSAELAEVARLLDDAARHEERVLRSAAEAAAPELEAAAERQLQALASGGAPGSPASHAPQAPAEAARRGPWGAARWSRWLLALAALVVGALSLRPLLAPGQDGAGEGRGTHAPGEAVLGANELRIEGVARTDAGGLVISWRVAPGELVFTVRVLDEATGRELFASPALGETRLELAPERTAGWPDALRVEVEALSKTGRSVAFDERALPAR